MSSLYGYANSYSPTPKRKRSAAPGDWLSALNARSQGLNTAYGLPKKAGSAGTSTGSEPTDPYASANAGVESIIAAMLAAVEREKQAAYESAQREAQMEYQKGLALAEGLKHLGISDAVQRAFGNAAQAQSGLAQGFSGNIRDQASAQAAEQQRLLSGTGQEAAVRNQGDAMGNVTYGVGGHMPATALNSMAAAFGADAALQPGFALQFGALAEQARRNQWVEDELPEWTNRIMDVHDKKPSMIQDAREDAYDRALELEKLARSGSESKITFRNLANGQIGVFENGKLVRAEGPAKAAKATEADYQMKDMGSYRQVWDANSNKFVGPKYPKPAKQSKGSTKQPALRDRGTYQQVWDPNTRQWIGPKYPKAYRPTKASTTKAAETPRANEAGRVTGRTDGVTDTQARAFKLKAFNLTKAWHNDGERLEDEKGNPVHLDPLGLVKYLVNQEGVPLDLAIRQMARFSPAARGWLKSRVNPLTGKVIPKSTKMEARAASVTTPQNAAVVEAAMEAGPRSGIKYVMGGTGNGSFDCSGYTRYMIRQQTGVDIPHNAGLQFRDPKGQSVPKGNLQPGDVVFFRSTSNRGGLGPPWHCGYYIGGGKFVEYYSTGNPARVSSLSDRSDYMGARRFGGGARA